MSYNVYSLPDTRTVLYHPDVGAANLHQCGHGKITVSAAGDLTSHTMTADGNVVVNKLKSTSGTIAWRFPRTPSETGSCAGGRNGRKTARIPHVLRWGP